MTLAYYGKSRRRQSWLLLGAVLALIAGMVLAVSGGQNVFAQDEEGDTDTATLKVDHVGATAPGFGEEDDCGPFTGDFDWAFHFVFQGSSTDFTSIDATFTGGTEVHSTFAGKHAFVYVNSDNGPITLTGASATTIHNGGQQDLDTEFNLSHICEGEGGEPVETTLTVIKIVDTNNNPEFTGVSSDFSINVTTDGGMAVHGPFAGSETGEVISITAPGQTFRVTEADTRGYNLAFSGDCTPVDGGISGDVFVAAGESKTCTLTNTAPPVTTPETGSITIVKVVDNNDNPAFTNVIGDFMIHVMTGGMDVTGSPAAGSTGTLYSDLAAGTYVVSEPDSLGYSPTFTGDCDAMGSITLAAGADATCTVTNTAPPVVDEGPFNVVIGKFVDDVEATVAFDFLVTYDVVADPEGPLAATDEPFSFTGTATSLAFEAGFDYSIEETGVDATCEGEDEFQLLGYSMSNVSLADAAAIVPSMTVPDIMSGDDDFFIAVHNAPCGPSAGTSTVIIEKDGGDAIGSTATFSTTGLLELGFDAILDDDGGFTLDDDAATGGVGNTITFIGLEGGADNDFTITEDEIAGWSLTGLSCTEENATDLTGQVVVDDVAGSLSFDLDASAGLIITCVFTNTQNPVAGTSDVTIVKDAGDLPNSTTSFTVVGLPGVDDFTLDDDPLTGTVDNSFFVPGLSDDSFTITEGETAGWSLEDIVCTEDGGADLGGVATISLDDRNVSFDIGPDAGLSITCTFTNQQASTGETPTVTATPTDETPTATPTDETPTATPTDETPTATPTDETPTETSTTGGATPETSTAEGVTDESAVAGATPIAPSTGTGTSAAERTATLGLVIAGLVAMTTGATLFAIRRRA